MLSFTPLPRTLQAALRDLHESSRDVRLSAMRDLARLAAGEHRDAAIGGLTQLLLDSEAVVRGESALCLGDVGATECLPALLELTSDDNQRVRQMALIAVGEVAPMGDERALAPVRHAVRASEPELRYQALIALNRLETSEHDSQVCQELVRALGDDDVELRYIALRLSDERWEPGEGAAPHQLVERVVCALADEVLKVRVAAAIYLGRRGDRSGDDVLVEGVRLGTKESDDHQAAIELAGDLRLEQARDALARHAFRRQPFGQSSATWHARVALAKLGDERARSALLRGLQAWSRDARTLAVAAVGRAGLVEAREQLLGLRDNPRRADPHAVEEALSRLDEASETRR